MSKMIYFSLKGLEKVTDQYIQGRGGKQGERSGSILGKRGDAGGIIQRDHFAEPCTVINDLIPLNVFK